MNDAVETTRAFQMADVRRKRPTARRAVARGSLFVGAQAFAMIAARTLPKGDALMMADVAGINGAKQAAMLMPLCHPLPLELVRIETRLDGARHAVHVFCEVATEAKTGVEMEALAGVNAALLTLYDLTKPVDPALSMGEIRLLFKEGGKKGLWLHPEGMSDAERERYQPRAAARLDGVLAAVITLSDRAHSGTYEDRSGPLVVDRLRALGAIIADAIVLPDDPDRLVARLQQLRDAGTRLVITSGGTGIGPRDQTPEALDACAARDVPGIGELFRAASAHHTAAASLSRARGVLLDQMLVIALPGSPKAVAQGLEILLPVIPHALAMVAGEGHG